MYIYMYHLFIYTLYLSNISTVLLKVVIKLDPNDLEQSFKNWRVVEYGWNARELFDFFEANMCHPDVSRSFHLKETCWKGETSSKAFLRNYSQKLLKLLSQSGFMLFYSIRFGNLDHSCILGMSLPRVSLSTRFSRPSCWGVRDSRRDVNALLDDFKNSHEHFFKCLAGSWGVVLRCLTNEYKSYYIYIYFVENRQCFVLFQFYRFFCWMNLGHQGWAFAMVTRHSFRNDGFFPERREPMSCICCSATPFLIRISMYNGYNCEPVSVVNESWWFWIRVRDSEF